MLSSSRRLVTRLAFPPASARAFSRTAARFDVKSSVSKIWPSAEEAVKDVKGDSIVLSGGFGLCGTADTLIGALAKRPEVKNLTCVSNNAGVGKFGLGALLHSGQIAKMIASYLGANKHFEKLYLDGKVSLELTPQGTLAERCRAGGAGIPAFFTPSGYGTAVQTGEIPIKYKEGTQQEIEVPGKPREVREFNGRGYLMEEAIIGDYALVKVWKADEYGNCVFRYAAQNFSGAMARSARMTIVEAEEIVPIGSLDPNHVHLPGIFVDRVVQSTAPKQVEVEVLREETSMQAIVAKTVRTQAATAVVAGRPSRSAAVAAGKLASAALNSSNANANGHSSQSPEPGTARRSRSPSSSLSPVPATPPPAGEALVDPEPSTVPVKRSASPAGTGSEDAKPVKKKRTRKPKEPEVYVIPDVERKETTFKGRLGYACLNTILRKQKPPVFCSRTCRIDTIEKEDKGMPYLKELGRQNVLDLIKMIEWTAAHHIYFLRVSSELFPFAAHPDYQYSLEYAAEELKLAGETARRLGVRLTSHPAQFCNLCSPRNVVIENAYRDLEYHNEFFTRMGMGKDSVMIIHGGGVHGDKEAALQRFRKHYKELSDGVKGRLVLENDEFSYSVDDLLPVCEDLNIPLVFDYHHHSIFPTNQPIEELMPRILALWESKGIRPKFHLSEPRKGAVTPMERRAHADRCQSLPTPLPDDIDLMIEAKDKEQAVFHLYRIYDLAPTIHESLRPPAEEETLQTAGRKSNKAKSPKKGKKGEVVGTDEIKAGDPNEEVKVEAAVEEGVAPLPEGKDAEGQAYSPPVDPENVQALQEQEQQAKPKKRVAGRSQKAKEVEPVAGDEPKPKKQRRAPKKKAAAIPTEPMQTDDSAAPA